MHVLVKETRHFSSLPHRVNKFHHSVLGQRWLGNRNLRKGIHWPVIYLKSWLQAAQLLPDFGELKGGCSLSIKTKSTEKNSNPENKEKTLLQQRSKGLLWGPGLAWSTLVKHSH